MNSPPKILLVDDQPEMELIVTYLGKRLGQEVTARPTVPSAWDYLAATPTPPDLILLDIKLPGPSGLELCRRIREAERALARHQLIAVFSHWDRTEEIESALRLGADAVVSKELLPRPDEWSERLREILQCGDSRGANVFLSSQQPSTEGWRAEVIATLDRALRGVSLALNPTLVLLLLRRGLSQTGRKLPNQEQVEAVLKNSRDGVKRFAQTAPPETLLTVALCLMEQLRYVFGPINAGERRLD